MTLNCADLLKMKVQTTQRQRDAVRFCERLLDVKYQGDLACNKTVSQFLSLYLDKAKGISNRKYSDTVY